MAKFKMTYPDEIIKEMNWVQKNADYIFGGMTRAGAEVAQSAMISTCPNEDVKRHIKLSKTYKTPSDGGINTKVYFSGYIPFHHPPSSKNRQFFTRRGNGGMYSTSKGVPADFLAILYEYGRSNLPWPRHPFVRKSFNKSRLEKAMLNAQKELSHGLLDSGSMSDIEAEYMRDLGVT